MALRFKLNVFTGVVFDVLGVEGLEVLEDDPPDDYATILTDFDTLPSRI